MSPLVQAAVFVAVSMPIVWVARRSLRHPRSHGFFRFFAFEAILVLLLLNVPYWVADPFGSRQLVSWLLLCVSGLFVAWGFVLLRRLGGFDPAAEASPSFAWESTGHLVTAGIYRYIRHSRVQTTITFDADVDAVIAAKELRFTQSPDE